MTHTAAQRPEWLWVIHTYIHTYTTYMYIPIVRLTGLSNTGLPVLDYIMYIPLSYKNRGPRGFYTGM